MFVALVTTALAQDVAVLYDPMELVVERQQPVEIMTTRQHPDITVELDLDADFVPKIAEPVDDDRL